MRSDAPVPGEAGREAAHDADYKPIELTAMRLLARREHSVEELRHKLLRRGYPATAVEAVVGQLSNRRLISDVRFAGGLVRSRSARGHGPVRIRAELRRQGVEEPVIQAEFAAVDCNWAQLASRVRVRKFGATVPEDGVERAKQARFLQYRGFTADQIRAALGHDADADGLWLDAACRSDPDPNG